MWFRWRRVFGWQTLCPIHFADPLGLIVVMSYAEQSASQDEIDALPDYYPAPTVEPKLNSYGRLGESVVALDYGLTHATSVADKRAYYQRHPNKPAVRIPSDA